MSTSPPGRLQARAPGEVGEQPQRALGDPHAAGAHGAGERRRIEHRLGGDVVRAAGVRGRGREAVRLGDVVAVHALQHEAVGQRQHGQPTGLEQRGGHERPREQAADLGSSLALEDQPGPQPHDAQVRVGRLDGVQHAFGGRLVARVERARNAVAGHDSSTARSFGPSE
jgi:hypothetical protein